MATWYYYNEKGEKIAVTGGQLKGLAKAGLITPETVVETEEGKKARAGKVKGLTFATPGSAQPAEEKSYGLSQPEVPSPFSASMPMPKKQADSPFTAAVPPVNQATPQSAPVSIAEDIKNTLIIGIPVCLLVSALVIVSISNFGGGGSFTATEQRDIDNFLARYGNEFGNNVWTTNQNGFTLLHVAAINGDYAAVKYCISKGANVNAKTRHGLTPLHGAANKGDEAIEVVKFLVSKGADVHVRNNEGDTPLDIARHWNARATNYSAVVRYLESVGSR